MKVCSISTNSYYLDELYPETELTIITKEQAYFYLQPKEYDLLKIRYEIQKVFEQSYVGVSFHFNEKSNFSIIIQCQNGTNDSSKSQIICNSTTIFLNSTFLLYDKETNNGGALFISIKNIEKRNILMKFMIKELFDLSLLQKNALNFGFITKIQDINFFSHLFPKEKKEN